MRKRKLFSVHCSKCKGEIEKSFKPNEKYQLCPHCIEAHELKVRLMEYRIALKA